MSQPCVREAHVRRCGHILDWPNVRTASGAMERYAWVRFSRHLTACQTTQNSTRQCFSGAMEELPLFSVSVGRFTVFTPTENPACTHTRHTVNSAGRWMKVQGKFKMQAHITTGVVMDIAAFKVSHSVGIDIDATALRAARVGQAPWGRWMKVQGKFKRLTLTPFCGTQGTQIQFSGAMKRFTWVRFAGKLTPCQTHTWTWRQSAHQWGAGWKLKNSSKGTSGASTHCQPDYRTRLSWLALLCPG